MDNEEYDLGPDDLDEPGGMTNEQFRLLVQRSLLATDYEATRELNRYLLGKIRGLSSTFDESERRDVVGVQMVAAAKAARAIVTKHVEKPRNYTMRAMSNAWADYVGVTAARRERESLRDYNEQPHVDRRSRRSARDVEVRLMIFDFRQKSQSPPDKRVGEVLLVAYTGDMSIRDACRALSYGTRDSDATCKKIQRDSANPKTRLAELLRELHWEPAEQNDWEL